MTALLFGCAEVPRANLLLITMDTTRADHLGCYGYGGQTSPNIDRIAREGVRFQEVTAQAAVTPVSHASILTGLNPYHHGLRALHGSADLRLNRSARTLAGILAEAGYGTAAFISAYPASSRFGLDRGFSHFDETFLDPAGQRTDKDGIVHTGEAQRRADATTDAAIEWLEKTAGVPFFLWIHYFDPHDPLLLPPPAYLKLCAGNLGNEKTDLISLYDCEIYFMDAQIGRLLQQIDRPGAGNRTLVAITADHGEGLGDHDWWSHGILFQEQIRLPLILRHPDLPEGRVVSDRIRSIDIAPTLLEILGIDATRIAFDGESALPAIHSPRPGPDRDAYSESRNLVAYSVPHSPGEFDRKDDQLYSLIQGKWKYIHHRFRPAESQLFDLEQDPFETRNRIGEEPEIARRLAASLGEVEAIFAPGVETPPPPDLRERLRSLGYLDP